MPSERRIELIPSAPPLPSILFTEDEPPPGFVDTLAPGGEVAFPVGAGPLAGAGSGAGMGMAPESYDVWLHARDPHTVVAHWDRGASPGAPQAAPHGEPGRWWIRMHEGRADGPVVSELPAPEDSGTSVLAVVQPGSGYVAELGYESVRTGWHPVAVSPVEYTPPDFETGAGAPECVGMAWGEVVAGSGVASWESGAHGEPVRHGDGWAPGEPWGVVAPAQEPVPAPSGPPPAVEAAVDPGTWEGPVEWSWRWWTGGGFDASSEALAQGEGGEDSGSAPGRGARPGPAGVGVPGTVADVAGGISSAGLAVEEAGATGRDFWLRVNAEVILHGSTRPDARVTVAGRPVRLRPDGSFSFRFAFPDGDFRLPVRAESADGVESLGARVRFLRDTRLEGEVGVHELAGAWDADLVQWGS